MNGSATSSLPPPDLHPDPCSPLRIEPHPSLTLTPPSYLVIIYSKVPKKKKKRKKRRGNTCRTTEC